MKSKIVFVIATLLLFGILLSAVSFAIGAVIEYNDITAQKNNSTPSQNEQGNAPENTAPEENPVVKPMRDNYFYTAKVGVYEGYTWIATAADNGYWQLQNDGTEKSLLYNGNGEWILINTDSRWITMPLFTYSYTMNKNEGSNNNVYSLNLHFYYQVCRNGVWEETLIPMDKNFFAYVDARYLYSQDSSWDVWDAEKVENGCYSAPVDQAYKLLVSVCCDASCIDFSDLDAVNFVMKVDAEADPGWFWQFEKYY